VIVNALRREATVVVQKSLHEGFGLGVAEAMWKRRPVVASDVGGHRVQIEHGVSGVLVPDARNLPRFGRAIADLLADPERRRRLGEAAHEQVRTRFLPDRHMAAWMRLLAELARWIHAEHLFGEPRALAHIEMASGAATRPAWASESSSGWKSTTPAYGCQRATSSWTVQ
jgi:hypothetical protein